MAALTSAALALGGVGMNVGAAIKNNKLQKQSQAAAKQAAQNLRGITEQNPYAAVKVPTMASKMAMDNVNQYSADTLSALQGTGAEGVIAGATGLNKGMRDAQLDIAATQAESEFNRDVMQAEAQGGINQRKAQREMDIETGVLEGAQQAAADARDSKNANISGAIAGLGGAINSVAGYEGADYVNPFTKKAKARKAKRKGATNGEFEVQDNLPQPNMA